MPVIGYYYCFAEYLPTVCSSALSNGKVTKGQSKTKYILYKQKRKYEVNGSNGNLLTLKSSRSQMFFKIGVFKTFANFIGKYLCRSLFLINLQVIRCWRPQHRCFPVKVF